MTRPVTTHIIGQRFGSLVAIEYTYIENDNGRRRGGWLCKCDCGNECVVKTANLTTGNTKSCGCYRVQQGKTRCIDIPTFNNKKEFGANAFNRLWLTYRNNATARNLDFLLTQDEFKNLTSQPCHYCGRLAIQVAKSENGYYFYNGIDRIDNSRGYQLDNCVPCCGQCNWAKKDLTYDEFLSWIRDLLAHQRG